MKKQIVILPVILAALILNTICGAFAAKHDGYLDEVFFSDFTAATISTNLGYGTGGDRTAPEITNGRAKLTMLTASNTSTDNYFRTQYSLVNSDYSDKLLTGVPLTKMQTVNFCIDIELGDYTSVYITSIVHKALDSRPSEHWVEFTTGGKMKLADGQSFDYQPDTNYSFNIYADFVNATYTIYLNGSLLAEDVEMKQDAYYALSFGLFYKKGTAEDFMYVDNLGYYKESEVEFYSELFEIDTQSFPVSNRSIDFEFNSNIVTDVTSLITITPAADFRADVIDNVVSVSFDTPLDFETDYTLEFCGEVTDWRGKTLDIDETVTFKTVKKQLVANVPVIEGTNGAALVSAEILNPLEEAKTVKLIVIQYNSNGEMLLKNITELEVAAPTDGGVTIDEVTDTAVLTDTVSIAAYVADENEKALSDGFARYNFETLTNSACVWNDSVGISLDKEIVSGEKIVAAGKVNKPGIRMLELSFMRDDAEFMHIPVFTDSEGKFTYSVKHNDIDGKYAVSVTGKTLSNSQLAEKYYLSDSGKESVKASINGAGDTLYSYLIAEGAQKLNIEASLITDSLVKILSEQIPISGVDKVETILKDGYTVESTIKVSSWDKFEQMYNDYSYILFVTADDKADYESYKALSSDEKGAFNNALVEKDIDTLADFRKSFSDLIEDYTAPEQQEPSTDGDGGGGGGGGGGGRPSSSPSVSVTIGTPFIEEEEKTQTNGQKISSFPDLDSASWVWEASESLKEKGIISGDEKGNLNPEKNVTRAEFLKMLTVALQIPQGAQCSFNDVSENDWFYPYAAAAQSSGIANGNSSGNFDGNANITRQDMAVMIYRAKKDLSDNANDFEASDADEISEYARDAVKALYSAGIINGMGDGSFGPKMFATRAQAIKIIYEMLS